ncbi:MAG: SDR family NAD(P)-dependent oxidoreductase [Nocardioides sp.]
MDKLVLLVTGGSRGIGAATAALGAQAGYAVAVGYRSDRAAAEAVVAGLAGPGIAVGANLASQAEVVRMFAELDDRLGRLHCPGQQRRGSGGAGPGRPDR